MYSRDNPDVLWVRSGAGSEGRGSFDEPFGRISTALERVKPGETIVLQSGIYTGNVTIQVSGAKDRPIRIVGENGTPARITGAAWFFYDVSDLIVEDLTFDECPMGAVSVIGACSRNIFNRLNFRNCGGAAEGCSLYIGGAGASCNVVENCSFDRSERSRKVGDASAGPVIALMISEGDTANHDALNTDHVFRGNTISHYDYGIAVGGGNMGNALFGHIIEKNRILNCSRSGVRVRCGDTTVRENRIEDCSGKGVEICAGNSSSMRDNRIERCAAGISVTGSGHTVRNNCILDFSLNGIHLAREIMEEESDRDSSRDSCTLVEENTLVVHAGSKEQNQTPVPFRLDAGTMGVVRKNLVHGSTPPYLRVRSDNGKRDDRIIDDNVSTGECKDYPGFRRINVEFSNPECGDFSNAVGYGAAGRLVSLKEETPVVDEDAGYRIALREEYATEEAMEGTDREEYLQKLFFTDEEPEEGSEDEE